MEAYAQVVLYVIPFFLTLIVVEALYGWRVKKNTFRSFDTITGISSGVSNSLKDVLGLTIVIVAYAWLYEKLALFQIENTWIVYAISFIAIDFAGYWQHRLRHHINYFWNEHVIHHSSEEFNLACALRQSVSSFFGIYALLLIPAAVFGVHPKVIAVVGPIHLFVQFWYHTRHIPKLGFIEYLIVTPSQHRVHHAINPIYLDKNLGQVFNVWDKMFGTFQEELDQEPCVYGIKVPAATWNPLLINFQHLWQLALDAWHANRWVDKLRIWLMPLGWRPADVMNKYPIDYITNPKDQVKYATPASPWLHSFSWFQLLMTHAFFIYLLANFVEIGFPNLLVYGGFIFLHIYASSALMDLNPSAFWLELVKCVGGLFWIWNSGDWFGISGYLVLGSALIAGYLILSLLVVSFFTISELKVKARLASN